MGKLALTGQTTLHWLATFTEDRTGISLTWQLSMHLGKTVDCEVHRNVVNTTDATFWLTSGHMLKDDVIELMHQNTQLVLVRQSTHKVWVVEQLKLRGIRVDADASRRHTVGADLVNAARERSEERLAHEQASGVKVEVKGLLVVRHGASPCYSCNVTRPALSVKVGRLRSLSTNVIEPRVTR